MSRIKEEEENTGFDLFWIGNGRRKGKEKRLEREIDGVA